MKINANLLTVVPVTFDAGATWVTDRWVLSTTGEARFSLPEGLMTGLRPNFFSANITLSSPVNNHFFFVIMDSTFNYQWETPIVNPYEQSLPSGTHDLSIDLFYNGLNSHLGDIAYISLYNPGGIESLNFIGFTDAFSWQDHRNTVEVIVE